MGASQTRSEHQHQYLVEKTGCKWWNFGILWNNLFFYVISLQTLGSVGWLIFNSALTVAVRVFVTSVTFFPPSGSVEGNWRKKWNKYQQKWAELFLEKLWRVHWHAEAKKTMASLVSSYLIIVHLQVRLWTSTGSDYHPVCVSGRWWIFPGLLNCSLAPASVWSSSCWI